MLVLRVHHSALDNMNMAQMYCSPCRGNVGLFVVFIKRSDTVETVTVWKNQTFIRGEMKYDGTNCEHSGLPLHHLGSYST